MAAATAPENPPQDKRLPYAPFTGRGRQTTSASSGLPTCSRYIRNAWTL